MKRWLSNLFKKYWRHLVFGLFSAALIFWGVINIIPSFIPIDKLSIQAAEARIKGDNATALKLYKIVSSRASDIDFTSNYELGNIYMEKKNYHAAEEYYLKAANNPAAPSSVFFQMEELYLKHLNTPRQQAKFIKFLEKVLHDLKKDDDNVMIVLSDFYNQTGHPDQAQEWAAKAKAVETKPTQH